MRSSGVALRQRWAGLSSTLQLRVVLGLSTAALAVVVGVFGVGIVRMQTRVRHADEQRFVDRGRVGAALMESLLSSTFHTSRMLDTRLYGMAHVSPHVFDQPVRDGTLAFAILFDPGGRVLAVSAH